MAALVVGDTVDDTTVDGMTADVVVLSAAGTVVAAVVELVVESVVATVDVGSVVEVSMLVVGVDDGVTAATSASSAPAEATIETPMTPTPRAAVANPIVLRRMDAERTDAA